MEFKNKNALSEKIISRANELRLQPKFLLVAIASIAQDGDVSDKQILRNYWKHILPEMTKAAISQEKSKDFERREVGIGALQTATRESIEKANVRNSRLIGDITEYLDSSISPLELHIVVYDELLKTYQKVGRISPRQKVNKGIAKKIKILCSDFIDEIKEYATLFEIDISNN